MEPDQIGSDRIESDRIGTDEKGLLLMRNLQGRPWPIGAIGMLGLVLLVEGFVTRHDREFTTIWAQSWKWSGQSASAREAKKSAVLCFGDSLVLHGVLPKVLSTRLERDAYNLAVFKGQAPASYFLLRRALDSGSKPAAVLVDGELLDADPTSMNRLWPELASLRDCGELAWAARSLNFFSATALAELLPSYKARWEIRSVVLGALAGQSTRPAIEDVRARRWNTIRNRGAQALPTADGPDPRAGLIANYVPTPWQAHPLNAVFTERFLDLAASRGVKVYWLLPPYYPGIQSCRERGGWDAGYMAFLRTLQTRHPNLNVIDGRHAGYTPESLFDLTHLNSLGAVAFSDAVAGVLRPQLLGDPRPAPRWVEIPHYQPPAEALLVDALNPKSAPMTRK